MFKLSTNSIIFLSNVVISGTLFLLFRETVSKVDVSSNVRQTVHLPIPNTNTVAALFHTHNTDTQRTTTHKAQRQNFTFNCVLCKYLLMSKVLSMLSI